MSLAESDWVPRHAEELRVPGCHNGSCVDVWVNTLGQHEVVIGATDRKLYLVTSESNKLSTRVIYDAEGECERIVSVVALPLDVLGGRATCVLMVTRDGIWYCSVLRSTGADVAAGVVHTAKLSGADFGHLPADRDTRWTLFGYVPQSLCVANRTVCMAFSGEIERRVKAGLSTAIAGEIDRRVTTSALAICLTLCIESDDKSISASRFEQVKQLKTSVLHPAIHGLLSFSRSALLRTAVSSDGSLWAAACTNGDVLLAKTTGETQLLKKLNGLAAGIDFFEPICISRSNAALGELLEPVGAPKSAPHLSIVDPAGRMVTVSHLDTPTPKFVRVRDLTDRVVEPPEPPALKPLAAKGPPKDELPKTVKKIWSVPSFLSSPNFGNSKAAEIRAFGPPATEITPAQPVPEMPLMVGWALSLGPTSTCMADFNLDGRPELVISTVGRALVFCVIEDMAGPQFKVLSVQQAPSHAYAMKMVHLRSQAKRELFVAGAQHVVVYPSHFFSNELARRVDMIHELLFQ